MIRKIGHTFADIAARSIKKAAAPWRSIKDQYDVDGLALFDAVRSPSFF